MVLIKSIKVSEKTHKLLTKICPKNKTADFAFKLKNKLELKYEWQISKIYLNVFSKMKR